MRAKFYDKSLERLSSVGVKYSQTSEPFYKLMIGHKNDKLTNYHRKLIQTSGKVKTRLEVSFYSSELKSKDTYIKIIK